MAADVLTMQDDMYDASIECMGHHCSPNMDLREYVDWDAHSQLSSHILES